MTRFIFLFFALAIGSIAFFFLSPSSPRKLREREVSVATESTRESHSEKKKDGPEKPSKKMAQEELKQSIKTEKDTANELQTIQTAIEALKMSLKTFSESQPAPIEQKSHPDLARQTRLPQTELRRIAAQSVVNLLCQEKGGTIAIATGSIIHPAGYILTNAHIVDNANQKQECTVRKGSPATPFAIAKLIFAPSAFAATTSITEKVKWDIALWKIDRPSDATPLPETFDALTLDTSHEFSSQEALATFSYPAELLSKEVILNSLYLVFSETAVESTDTYFIQSLAGLGSQQGSSGGALLDPASGKFVGLIFAIDKEAEINKRRLFALRASRIDEIMEQETGKTLDEYLAQ